MRSLIALTAFACCIAAAPAPHAAKLAPKPTVVLLHPGSKPPDREAIVIPAASPLKLASFPRDFESNATFSGRISLSGAYEVGGYGDDAFATFWPDTKSRATLPYWREHGGPDELELTNDWAFVQAVVPKDKLARLKSGKLESVRGHVTIVADDYETSIECDVASFSVRFVSVVAKPVQIAAIPESEEGC
jgi:hypothetical protein